MHSHIARDCSKSFLRKIWRKKDETLKSTQEKYEGNYTVGQPNAKGEAKELNHADDQKEL